MPLVINQVQTASAIGGMPTTNLSRIYTTGATFYVNSNCANPGAGTTPESAVLRLSEALALCTANTGDVIFLMPNHAETLSSAAGLSLSTAGIEIIGLGVGENRARFTFDTSVASGWDITGPNIAIVNVIFKVDVDALTNIIDISAAYCILSNCEFYEGTAKQWLTAVTFTNVAADHCRLQDCTFISATAGAASAINIAAAVDDLTIQNCKIQGDFSVAGISSASIFTNSWIDANRVANTNADDWAIELTAAATGFLTDNRLYADAAATMLDPGSMKCIGNRGVIAIDENDFPIPAGVVLSDTTQIYSDTTTIASDLVLTYSDTAAIHSDTTIIASDVVILVSDTTAIHTQTTTIASDLVIAASDIAVVEANYTAIYSDTTIIASDLVIITSDTTQIASDLVIAASDIVIVVSDTTAIHTLATSAYSDTAIIYSDTSIIYSDTTIIYSDTTIVTSDLVIITSDTTAIHSDTTIIASDVVILVSDTTQIASDLVLTYSDTTVITSDTAVIETTVRAIGVPVGIAGTFNDNTLTNNTQVVTLATATGGDVYIEEITLAKDATLLAGPTNVELSTDNVYGNTGVNDPVATVATATVTANTIQKASSFAVLALTPFVLESGKKIFAHGSDAVGSSAGAIKFCIIGRRMAAGATLA